MWQDMFALGVPLLEKIVRPALVYAFLVAGLRLAGKRELAQLNPFDLVVLLTLSNTVQNAIIGDDNTVTGGIIGAVALLTINYAVVDGNIKLVLFDQRPASSTNGKVQEVFFGQINYQLVRVPPGVVNGFTAIGGSRAIVANCADVAHDPTEITRIDPFTPTIPYDWKPKHG